MLLMEIDHMMGSGSPPTDDAEYKISSYHAVNRVDSQLLLVTLGEVTGCLYSRLLIFYVMLYLRGSPAPAALAGRGIPVSDA